MMNILVTGCAGFIGFHLTQRLLREGHSVVGVDSLSDYYSPELKVARLAQLGVEIDINDQQGGESRSADGRFIFIRADIESDATFSALDGVLGGASFDVVCHLAAQAGVRYSITNPQGYITSNLVGFFNVLEYCRRTQPQRFVFASSSSVYGNSSSIPYVESESADRPESLYAATKRSNELMAYSYASLYGINSIGLRFFTVYGAWGRPDMAPFLFTSAIVDGRPIEVFNGGDMSRDFTYIDDIVEGVYRVIVQEPATQQALVGDNRSFRIYNIGNSKPVALETFISTIERIVGRTAQRVYKPMQQGDVKRTYANTSLMERDYGYRPNTSIEEGLRVLVEWYLQSYGHTLG